jgi:hypothetical protein
MAIPKKGLRKITVDGFIYKWSTTGNDGGINLSIIPFTVEGQILTAGFGYHSQEVGRTPLPAGGYAYHHQQTMIVTPGIVKQVIEYGLKVGWQPRQKDKPLNLGSLDAVITLNLIGFPRPAEVPMPKKT